MVEFARELKNELIKELGEARALSARVAAKSPARPHIDALIQVYERLVIILDKFIKEGANDMEKLKAEIKILRTEKIEDIVNADKNNWAETMIKKIAEEIQPGYRVQLEPGSISWAYFSSRVYDMKARKPQALGDEYWPKTKGGKIYLYRFNNEQQKAYMAKKAAQEARRGRMSPAGRG